MKTLLLFSVLFMFQIVRSQDMRDHWIFGDSIYVHFGLLGPEVSTISDFIASEGVASVSDSLGKLVVYSNQSKIYNKNFQFLLNGDSLNDVDQNSSSTQGCVLLPLKDRYALFHSITHGVPRTSLAMTLIDIEANEGNGEVFPEFKAIILLDDFMSEQLQFTRHGNGRDWWLIARKLRESLDLYTNTFIIYRLIDEEVVFHDTISIGLESFFVGEMSISQQGDRIGLVSKSRGIAQLFDFDRCLGIVNNPRIIVNNGSSSIYGCAFSPKGKYFYYSYDNVDKIFQTNVETLETIEIFPGFSDVSVSSGQMELGPDGKLYINFWSAISFGGEPYNQYLGVINFPDSAGLSCDFSPLGVGPYPYRNISRGLPNHPNYYLGPLTGSPCDTLSNVDTTTAIQPIHVAPAQPCFELRASGSGSITLNIESSFLNSTIELYNSSGAQVYTGQVNTTNSMLSTANWTPGVYVARLRTPNGNCPAQKFVVMP